MSGVGWGFSQNRFGVTISMAFAVCVKINESFSMNDEFEDICDERKT